MSVKRRASSPSILSLDDSPASSADSACFESSRSYSRCLVVRQLALCHLCQRKLVKLFQGLPFTLQGRRKFIRDDRHCDGQPFGQELLERLAWGGSTPSISFQRLIGKRDGNSLNHRIYTSTGNLSSVDL